MSRQLGYLEKLMVQRLQSGSYNNFHVTAVYNQAVSLSHIIHALRALLVENPILLCHITEDNSQLKLVNTDLLVKDVVVSQDYKEIDSAFLRKLDDLEFSLKDDKLHFKVILSNKNQTLSFITDHLLFDGVSGSKFIELFHQCLINVETNDLPTTILTKEEISKIEIYLPPPLEELFQFKTNDIKAPVAPSSSLIKWPGKSVASLNYDPYYAKINITKLELLQVLKTLKPLKVSLTNHIVSCLMKLVVNPILSNHKNLLKDESDWYIPIKIAMDARRNLENAPLFANIFYPGNIKYIVHPIAEKGTSAEIISYAKENSIALQQELAELTDSLQIQYNTLHDKDDSYMFSFYSNMLNKTRPDGVKVSNLGLIKFNDTHQYKVIDLVFNQSIGTVASDFMASCISSEVGGMNICLGIHKGTCEIEDLEKYCDLFKKGLCFEL